MSGGIKNLIRQALIALGIPLTRNIRYDILTKKILQAHLKSNSNCIDVGAHKGEILDLFFRYAPSGKHLAFEPIPQFYKELQRDFGQRMTVYPFALGSRTGKALFNHVVNAPAYSGLQQRTYKEANPRIEHIEVDVIRLDELTQDLPSPIDLIKIDVEGGELDVLKGAQNLLKRDQPLLIFEFGKGASEYYGTMPHHMLDLLGALGYRIWTIGGYCRKETALSAEKLETIYSTGTDYYFIAATGH